MKKTSVIVLLIVTAIFSLTTGVFAASKLTTIQAYLNGEIKFLKDGVSWRSTDDKGNEMLPITYLGKTYLPLAAFATAVNIPISYDAARNTVLIGRSDVQTTLYGKQIKTDYASSAFFDVIDKNQLVFGGKQFKGAFAVGASSNETYNMSIDFGQKYSTLHLVLVGKADMKVKVYNKDKQQLSDEIILVEGELKEADVDLQGSDGVILYPYTNDEDRTDYPLAYVLKDSYLQ